jgi:hypothetical protein
VILFSIDGTSRILFDSGPDFAMTPESWSPKGSKLLVEFFGGGDRCVGNPGLGEPEPTVLEVR